MSVSVPSQKDRKYDRQLRLWAASGQKALEDAHVCLLGSSPVATETLKNLILPNVGAYTVVDAGKVTAQDLSGNFFLDTDSLGQSRAQAVCQLLNELNKESKGTWRDEQVSQLVHANLGYFDQFSLVVATPASFDSYADLEQLSDYLFSRHIPLLVVSTVGFYGYVRIVINELPVIDTHPASLVDLRLDAPWPELKQYVAGFPEPTTQALRDHVPMIVIILQAAEAWITEHGSLPSKATDKAAFRKTIEAKRSGDSENVEEAVAAVWRLYQKSDKVPSDIQTLFDACEVLTDDSDPTFWTLVRALKLFVAQTGLLPLSGTIPDFKSYTKDYVDIQRIYKNKANADLALMKDIVSKADLQITDAVLEEFCKNSRYLHLSRGSSISNDVHADNLKSLASVDSEDLLPLYYVIRASQMASTKNPCTAAEVHSTLKSIGVSGDVDDYAVEVARYENREMHNIASVMGGVAAQEIVKILTKQYVPLNNTVVFDGIKSKMDKWRL